LEQPHHQQPDLQLHQRLGQAHPLTAPIGSKVAVVSSTKCRCRRKSRQVADRLAAANETVSSTPLSAGVLGRGRRVAGSRGTNVAWNAAKDARSQSAPRRHGRMQLLRTTGCSEQEGDREAHQGEPSQTGGSKNG
jgi:hypothetical protein